MSAVAILALVLAVLDTLVILGVAGALLWVLRRPALALPALGAIATGPLVKGPKAGPGAVPADLSHFTVPEE